jgi:hypothetical protein
MHACPAWLPASLMTYLNLVFAFLPPSPNPTQLCCLSFSPPPHFVPPVSNQVVATNANAAYVNLTRNLWAAMLRTGDANLLVRARCVALCASACEPTGVLQSRLQHIIPAPSSALARTWAPYQLGALLVGNVHCRHISTRKQRRTQPHRAFPGDPTGRGADSGRCPDALVLRSRPGA